MEALELQKALSEMNGSLGPLGRSVARKIAAVTELAWAPVVAEDLRHPAAVGRRSLGVRAMQWYSSRILERQMTDPELKEIFWRVSQFVEPPASLFHPRVLLKALRPPHPKARVKNNDART